MSLDLAVGPVQPLHRLALAVECLDPITERLVGTPLRVGRELPTSPFVPVRHPQWPCDPLDRSGASRYKLRRDIVRIVGGRDMVLPKEVTIRLDDPARRFVPRRIQVLLWPPGQLDGPPYIEAERRLLRVWVWPGAAGSFPGGSTVVRGRVTRGGQPARWARVRAVGPMGRIAGRAHADDRGEFVLVVTVSGQQPLESAIPVKLYVTAAQDVLAVDPLDPLADPLADLVVEPVRRSPAPPAPPLQDTQRLRGIAQPATYVVNQLGPLNVVATTGAEMVLTDDIVFQP